MMRDRHVERSWPTGVVYILKDLKNASSFEWLACVSLRHHPVILSAMLLVVWAFSLAAFAILAQCQTYTLSGCHRHGRVEWVMPSICPCSAIVQS